MLPIGNTLNELITSSTSQTTTATPNKRKNTRNKVTVLSKKAKTGNQTIIETGDPTIPSGGMNICDISEKIFSLIIFHLFNSVIVEIEKNKLKKNNNLTTDEEEKKKITLVETNEALQLTCKQFKKFTDCFYKQLIWKTFPGSGDLTTHDLTKMLFKFCITKFPDESPLPINSLQYLLTFSNASGSRSTLCKTFNLIIKNHSEFNSPGNLDEICFIKSNLKSHVATKFDDVNLNKDSDFISIKKRINAVAKKKVLFEKKVKKKIISNNKKQKTKNEKIKITDLEIKKLVTKNHKRILEKDFDLKNTDLSLFVKIKENLTILTLAEKDINDLASNRKLRAIAFCGYEFLSNKKFEEFDRILDGKTITGFPMFPLFEMISGINGNALLHFDDSYLQAVDWSKRPICQDSDIYVNYQRSMSFKTKYFASLPSTLPPDNEFKRLCSQYIHSTEFGLFLKKIIKIHIEKQTTGQNHKQLVEHLIGTKKNNEPTALHFISLYSGNKHAAQSLIEIYRDFINKDVLPFINQTICKIRGKFLGYTPLHLAVMYPENDELIEYLLSLGANPSIESDNGLNVLELAIFHGQQSYVEILLKHPKIDKNRIKISNIKNSFLPKNVSYGYFDLSYLDVEMQNFLIQKGISFIEGETLEKFLDKLFYVIEKYKYELPRITTIDLLNNIIPQMQKKFPNESINFIERLIDVKKKGFFPLDILRELKNDVLKANHPSIRLVDKITEILKKEKNTYTIQIVLELIAEKIITAYPNRQEESFISFSQEIEKNSDNNEYYEALARLSVISDRNNHNPLNLNENDEKSLQTSISELFDSKSVDELAGTAAGISNETMSELRNLSINDTQSFHEAFINFFKNPHRGSFEFESIMPKINFELLSTISPDFNLLNALAMLPHQEFVKCISQINMKYSTFETLLKDFKNKDLNDPYYRSLLSHREILSWNF